MIVSILTYRSGAVEMISDTLDGTIIYAANNTQGTYQRT